MHKYNNPNTGRGVLQLQCWVSRKPQSGAALDKHEAMEAKFRTEYDFFNVIIS